MKAYTDPEQSKKLAEILPFESADMHYKYILPKSKNLYNTPDVGNPKEINELYNKIFNKESPLSLEEFGIPCWSLEALLQSLPRYNNLKPVIDLEEISIQYSGADLYTVADNLVDACYEMILELNKLNLL